MFGIDVYKKIYNRDLDEHKFISYYKILEIFIIDFLLFLLLKMMFRELVYDIVFILYISVIILQVIYITDYFRNGFSIENTGITIYKLFQKKEIKYSEIKYIVISHAVGRTSTVGYLGKFRRCSGGKIRFKPYPWITLCNKISDKITKEVSDTLDRKSVDYLLKKNGFIYSFIWNRYAMEKLLIHPEVNIFISKSIEVRYKREIEELVVKYDIPKDRLHIIKDKVVMHFLWDNEFKKTFPEWNEDDLCV